MKNLQTNNSNCDVVFNDENNSDNNGFELTYNECLDYIKSFNGSIHSYFEDYKNGFVSIVSNKTGVTLFETKVL